MARAASHRNLHVALVTGANHGIGAATAHALATGGVRVVVTYFRLKNEKDPRIPETYRRARASNADAVVAAIRAMGGASVAVEADLVDTLNIPRLFDHAEREFGPVDILVNNASGWLPDTFNVDVDDVFGLPCQRVEADTFDRQFAIDARAAAVLISEFALRHIDRNAEWGRIIGVTSGGPGGFPSEVSYGAAKAALENYTMSAALELAKRGVIANVVHPPPTDTGWLTSTVRQYVAARPDLGRIAQPDDVAAVIGYLASEEAGLISGNVVHLRCKSSQAARPSLA
jgi:3-oxoacyl-[acyl-carrier protein] reductase